MSRIQSWTTAKLPKETPASTVEHSLLQRSVDSSLAHSLFVPMHYEEKYSYPLLVWLHGPGGDERQLQRVMPLISMRNYVAVGPQGTCTEEEQGFDWLQTERGINDAQQRVFHSIELAKAKFNISTKRIFLAGYESGGSMALRIGLNHPHCFAGLLSIGGPFPTEGSPLSHLNQVRRLPLFIAQGRQSNNYPVEKYCEELRLFHAAGLSVSLRQYPGGDELTTVMLQDMDAWMMEQVTGATTPSNDVVWSFPSELN